MPVTAVMYSTQASTHVAQVAQELIRFGGDEVVEAACGKACARSSLTNSWMVPSGQTQPQKTGPNRIASKKPMTISTKDDSWIFCTKVPTVANW